MDGALTNLKSSDSTSISETAGRNRVGISALNKRFNLKANSAAQYHDSMRLLTGARSVPSTNNVSGWY